jgi:tRNA pseudouridine38-40 synthase
MNNDVRNIALTLSYDGSAYHGWQRQANALTVQEVLETTLERVLQEKVHVIGCGRTDARVHAQTYVANFRTVSNIPPERLPFALNSLLPRDVAVSGAAYVPFEFHAVFSCVRKEYTYKVLNSAIRDPFWERRAWWIPQKLDVGQMRLAAAEFVGSHDFAAMRSVGTDTKTTVRTIFAFDILENSGIIGLRIAANGFLYNMARAIAGTLVYVGQGKLKPADIGAILVGGERSKGGPTAPPEGLYLTAAEYSGFAGILGMEK